MDEDRRQPGNDRRKGDRRATPPEPRPEPDPRYAKLKAIDEAITEDEDGNPLERSSRRLTAAAMHCADCGRITIVGPGGFLRCASLEGYTDTAGPPKGASADRTVIYCGGWAIR